MMSSCVDWARAGGMLACLAAAAACGRPASQAPRASAAPPRQISFDDLEFDIQRDGHFDRRLLTPAIVDLDGRPVRLGGYINGMSTYKTSGITEFVLVRDNGACCFGPGAYIFHNVQVFMRDGETVEFNVRPILLEGIFSLHEWVGPDGRCYSIYRLSEARQVG